MHTGLNLLKMKLEEFIVPLGNTFLELNDGNSQVKEGSFRKTVNLKEISFFSVDICIVIIINDCH